MKFNKFSFRAAILTVLIAILLVSSLPFTSAQANWLQGWTYRRAITITEQSGNALTNYTVKIVLNTSVFDYSKAKNDGGDIQFTDSDGVTLLPYYIEKWNASGESIIWVKVPSIAANSIYTIFMYYGKSDAVSASDAENTFLIYDDFDDNDISDWIIESGNWGAENGYLRSNNDGDEYYIKKLFPDEQDPNDNYIVEFKALDDNYACGDPAFYIYADNGEFFGIIISSYNNGFRAEAHDGASSWITTGNIEQWHNYAFILKKDGTLIAKDLDYDKEVSITTSITASKYVAIRLFAGYTYNFDDLKVRKYVEPEPSIQIGEEQQYTPDTSESILALALETDKLAYNESETITVTATLYNGSQMLADKLIIFEYAGITKTAYTDTVGKAVATFTAQGSGEQTITAYMAENQTVKASVKIFVQANSDSQTESFWDKIANFFTSIFNFNFNIIWPWEPETEIENPVTLKINITNAADPSSFEVYVKKEVRFGPDIRYKAEYNSTTGLWDVTLEKDSKIWIIVISGNYYIETDRFTISADMTKTIEFSAAEKIEGWIWLKKTMGWWP